MNIKIPVDIEQLEKLYLEDKQSANQIAPILGVSSETILRRLRELGIVRTSSESLTKELNPFFGRTHTKESKQKMSIKLTGLPGPMLGRKHSEESKQKMRIVNLQNGNKPPDQTGFHLSEEARLKISKAHRGPNHYNWKGGTVDYGSDWLWQKKKCYERDNWDCQICRKHGGLLHAHHIIPYRICKSNHLDNLITLCQPCHTEVEREKRNGWNDS